MEKFSFSGLWKHAGSTYISLAIGAADATLSYFGVVALPAWAHALVGIASAALLFYKGQPKPVSPQLVP